MHGLNSLVVCMPINSTRVFEKVVTKGYLYHIARQTDKYSIVFVEVSKNHNYTHKGPLTCWHIADPFAMSF